MAAHERPRAAAAARLRGAGAGALERAPRALPAALRREQHAGLQPDDAGAVLPRAAPADAPHLPQAARRDDPEEPAAAQAAPSRRSRDFTDGHVPAGARRRRARGAPRPSQARRDDVRRVLLCSGKVYYALLAGAPRARASTTTAHRARRAALSVPAPRARRRCSRAIRRRAQVFWVQEEPANMGALAVHRSACCDRCSAGAR